MGLILKETASNYEPVSEGLHPAICVSVIDLGVQYSKLYNKEQPKVMLTWEISDEGTNGEDMTKTISKEYTASFNEKSTLRKNLKSWRGREFTAEELEAFDLRKVLGAACQLQVIHNKNGDRTYANIESIVSFPRGMKKPEAKAPLVHLDLDDPGWRSVLVTLPDWIQDKILNSKGMEKQEDSGFEEDRPFRDEEMPV